MLVSSLSLSLFGLGLGLVSATPSLGDAKSQAAASKACARLTAAFAQDVFALNTTEYLNQSTNIWSVTCIFQPNCVFQPTTAQELSQGIQIIKAAGSKFSVRSGGHMPVPGAQSVEPGVFISMSGLNQKTLHPSTGTISIGPGQTWRDVYEFLAPYNLAVNGGRYPTVGVGGLLVGGGIGYFASTQGWATDNVVAFEVVLANGAVVEATQTNQYADLFWALRGGNNNFGVVTRFDVRTFPATSAYVASVLWNLGGGGNASDGFFKALSDYVAPGGGVDNPRAGIAAQPSTGLYLSQITAFELGNDTAGAPFANFSALQNPILAAAGGVVYDSWTEVLDLVSAQQGADDAYRRFFWTFSFAPDKRAISIANRTVFDKVFAELTAVEGAVVSINMQPISGAMLRASSARGGNALDIDPATGTFIGLYPILPSSLSLPLSLFLSIYFSFSPFFLFFLSLSLSRSLFHFLSLFLFSCIFSLSFLFFIYFSPFFPSIFCGFPHETLGARLQGRAKI
jgi:hypothetical protein